MLDLKSSGTTAAELPRTTAFTNLSMLFAGTSADRSQFNLHASVFLLRSDLSLFVFLSRYTFVFFIREGNKYDSFTFEILAELIVIEYGA